MRTRMKIGRLRATAVGGFVAVMAAVANGQAVAAGDEATDAAPGPAGRWTLMLNETNRQCRLTLRPDPVAKMYRMGLPAGCRRAIPILASVSGWAPAGKAALEFEDDDGKPVLAFTATDDAGNLVAKGPEGEVYSLVSLEGAHVAAPGREPAPVPPLEGASWDRLMMAQAGTTGAAKAAPAPGGKAAAPGPADIPGRYAILRKGGKDTGCLLNLDAKAKGPKGGKKVSLLPDCKDQGIKIFDPRGWRLEDGRLTLTAKKGHETHLDFRGDGTWQKDPKEGTPLSLKKS